MHYSYVLCVLQPTERTTVNSMNETKITVEMRKRFIEICVNYILHFKEDKLNIQTKNTKKHVGYIQQQYDGLQSKHR